MFLWYFNKVQWILKAVQVWSRLIGRTLSCLIALQENLAARSCVFLWFVSCTEEGGLAVKTLSWDSFVYHSLLTQHFRN